MGTIKPKHKHVAIAVVVALSLLSAWRIYVVHPSKDYKSYYHQFYDDGYMDGGLGVALEVSASHKKINYDEWDKLDFTWPDQPGFGSNTEYEVFNPKSPRYLGSGGPYPSAVFDELTTLKGVHPFFNLRNEEGSKGKILRLYMVIPDMKSEACKYIEDQEIDIPPDNHEIAHDPTSLLYRGCFRHDKIIYLFIPMAANNT